MSSNTSVESQFSVLFAASSIGTMTISIPRASLIDTTFTFDARETSTFFRVQINWASKDYNVQVFLFKIILNS